MIPDVPAVPGASSRLLVLMPTRRGSSSFESRFRRKAIAFDPWTARLTERASRVVEFGQSRAGANWLAKPSSAVLTFVSAAGAPADAWRNRQ